MAEESHRPGLRVGVLGHGQHGKSALVAALLARSTERRGEALIDFVTVGGGDAPVARAEPVLRSFRLDTAERVYSGIDVRAHPRFTRHAGLAAAAVDACLLVVSAVDGVMPQTREHALLARHLTPGGMVVFINRCDEVTDLEQLDLAEIETRQMLVDVGYDGDAVTVVRGAAPEGRWDAAARRRIRAEAVVRAPWEPALDALLDALDRSLVDAVRDEEAPLWATVLHRWRRPAVAPEAGRVIVEVSVRRGVLLRGARVQVSNRNGAQRGATMREARVGGNATYRIAAGESGTALLSVDGTLRAYERFPRLGDVLQQPGAAPAPNPLRVRLRLLDASVGGRRTPMRSGYLAMAWLFGRFVGCRVLLPEEAWSMAPGETRDDVTLDVSCPTAAPAGTTFVLRGGSHELKPRSQRGALWGGLFAVGEVLGPAR
jgi:elongation factor Tu